MDSPYIFVDKTLEQTDNVTRHLHRGYAIQRVWRNSDVTEWLMKRVGDEYRLCMWVCSDVAGHMLMRLPPVVGAKTYVRHVGATSKQPVDFIWDNFIPDGDAGEVYYDQNYDD